MPSLSVKYGNPKNLEEFFFFTRDIEFSKIVVYQGGKVIKTITNIDEFEKGITLAETQDQELFMQLLNRRNFTISINCNGQFFVPIKESAQSNESTINASENVKPLSILFAIALVSILINIMYLGNNPNLTNMHLWYETIIPMYRIDILTLLILGCAIPIYVLHDNRGWAYLLGLPILLFYTAIEAYYYFEFDGFWLEYPILITLNILVKSLVIVILLGKIGNVIRNLKSAEGYGADGVLD